jgi:predicted DNA-binding helix-hairpin-helix protein
MLVQTAPDVSDKLALQADNARLEAAGDDPRSERVPSSPSSRDIRGCIANLTTPTGKIAVLKAMVTTTCEQDCAYCPFRAGRDMRRVTFKPDELAAAFDQVRRAGLVRGLFLSSSVAGGGPRTQDKLIETVEIVRRRYGFAGYVHLKIMPGAEYDQVRRAMQIADRVSVNLEAPNGQRLAGLCPHKDFEQDLLERLGWAERIRREEGLRASSTTQFVVGAADESDVELLSITAYLYSRLGLRRAYYSAFSPVPDTPLENLSPESPLRQHRLYQSSFLLRDYGFDVEELSFEPTGNLPLDVDPKLAWARDHLTEAPVDVNSATRRELLRVPGIGPRGADAILRARQIGRLRDISDLRGLGVRGVDRVAPFILVGGRRPPRQLPLF